MEYYLNNGKEQTGPFDLEQLSNVENKTDYHVWYEGLDDWQTLSSFLAKKNSKNNLQENNNREIEITIPDAKRAIPQNSKYSNKLINIVILGIFTTVCIILTVLLFNFKFRSENLQNEVSRSNRERDTLSAILAYTSYSYPIVIYDLFFENSSGPWSKREVGMEFKSSESKFISPIISFAKSSPHFNTQVVLKIKFFDQKGGLLHNSHSPQDFTAIDTLYLTGDLPVATFKFPGPIPEKIYLPGWGSNQSPSYLPGKYKVQIWFENKCLYEGGFKII